MPPFSMKCWIIVWELVVNSDGIQEKFVSINEGREMNIICTPIHLPNGVKSAILSWEMCKQTQTQC